MDPEVRQLLAECPEAGRDRLAKQLDSIDLAHARSAFHRATAPADASAVPGAVEPLDASFFDDVSADAATTARWRDLGLKAVAAGEVCALLMAGGQGTRLGSALPKGMYDIGLASGRSLYRLQAERISRLERLAGAAAGAVPWYIMTSENTYEETRRFLESHAYFGLLASQVVFFRQGELPCFDLSGRLMRGATPDTLAMAPDGNGGIFRALDTQGILRDIAGRGVKYVHVYGVDNCLVRVGDPVFVGFCIERGVDAGAKVVTKAYPTESVGVFARRGGEVQVVEYSEIDAALATAVGPDGVLRFNAGNIANHLFTTEFLERAVSKLDALKYHVAKKKIPSADASGAVEKRDGIKLELFVFDVFVFANRVGLLYVPRSDEFSPLKNASGAADGAPEHARGDLWALHRRFLEEAGAVVQGEGACEIAPSITYAGEGLEKFSGKTIVLPFLA